LLEAWREFLRGKRKKVDVQQFGAHLMDNVLALHYDLVNGIYCHGGYHAFKISDPKLRDIHKASVHDRLLHHALHRKLYPFFDKTFIPDSYSCRVGKGTHKALNRFNAFARAVSKNNTRTCWVLKCDIRKYFASIDHAILFDILGRSISNENIAQLLVQIVHSFSSLREGKGLPLGNLTSQLLVNVYMNEFDQYVKHILRAKYYIRYADDFVLLSDDREVLQKLLPRITGFLHDRLALELHSQKVFLKTFASGVDFLGWTHFLYHRTLRTSTKQRMVRTLQSNGFKRESLQSYVGLLSHGNAYTLRESLSYDSFNSSETR